MPRRLPVLWGKAAVALAAVFAASVPAVLAAFFAGQSILAKVGLDTSFGQPGVARAVLGSALYLAVAAVLGLGLGALLRNTAAAVTALFGLLFGLQLLAGLIPGATGVTLEKFMPSTAGQAIASVHPDPATSLGPWTGLGLFMWVRGRGAGRRRQANEPRRRMTRSRGRTRAAGKGQGRPTPLGVAGLRRHEPGRPRRAALAAFEHICPRAGQNLLDKRRILGPDVIEVLFVENPAEAGQAHLRAAELVLRSPVTRSRAPAGAQKRRSPPPVPATAASVPA